MAEQAFYQFDFLAGAPALQAPIHRHMTLYQAAIHTPRAVDLTAGAWHKEQAALSDPHDTHMTQALDHLLRRTGVEVARYTSVRDPHGGSCLAGFAPAAFAQRAPSKLRLTLWLCLTWLGCEAATEPTASTKDVLSPSGVSAAPASHQAELLDLCPDRSRTAATMQRPHPVTGGSFYYAVVGIDAQPWTTTNGGPCFTNAIWIVEYNETDAVGAAPDLLTQAVEASCCNEPWHACDSGALHRVRLCINHVTLWRNKGKGMNDRELIGFFPEAS